MAASQPQGGSGTIKKWFMDKGYGFIQSDLSDHDIFVHFSVITNNDRKSLNIGEVVQFETEVDQNTGKLRATACSGDGTGEPAPQRRNNNFGGRRGGNNNFGGGYGGRGGQQGGYSAYGGQQQQGGYGGNQQYGGNQGSYSGGSFPYQQQQQGYQQPQGYGGYQQQ